MDDQRRKFARDLIPVSWIVAAVAVGLGFAALFAWLSR